MLYDAERMQPLYRLSIGNLGSSFAVEVATRIGLPEDIIVELSAKLGEDFINMDNFLQSITRDKIFWEDKRKEIIETNNSLALNKVSQPAKTKADKDVEDQSIKNAIIEKGDSVRLNGQTAIGIILEIQGKQATIAFGSIKSVVALNRLDLVRKKIR